MRRSHHRAHAPLLGAVLRHWHRRVGVAAAIFLIWLGLSGVALNQGVALGLDTIRIDWPWLMNWYGLPTSPPQTGWFIDSHWLIATDDGALLDGAPLHPDVHAPLGIAAASGLLFIATRDSLVLTTPSGQRVDELRMPPLPIAAIRRIGKIDDKVAIQDLDVYASKDGDQWSRVPADAVQWSSPEVLPEVERERAAPFVRPHLNLARILADAHSGRLLGRYGPWIINTAALAAILLAISGVWMVIRSSRRRHHHHSS